MANSADTNQYYREEAKELLQSVEQQLLELEEHPDDSDILNGIFRAFHTIKGSGSMFGYDEVADFTHDLESLFDLLRDRQLEMTKEITDITLSAKDYISSLIFEEDSDTNYGEAIRKRIRLIIEGVGGTREQKSNFSADDFRTGDLTGTERDDEQKGRIYRINFVPHADFFLRGAKIIPMFKELSNLGTCAFYGHPEKIPPLEEFDPEECRTTWTILLSTDQSEVQIKDVFIFVEDYAEIEIDVIDEDNRLFVDEEYKRIGEILYEQGHITSEDIDKIVAKNAKFGELALKEGIIDKETLETALKEQEFVRSERRKRIQKYTSSTMRVDSRKLDKVVNLVGELVTLQARMSQFNQGFSSSSLKEKNELETINESLERLTVELRDSTMEIRMVPLAETFNSFKRLVRDLSAELGKKVDFQTSGIETELDKNIIDALHDPLVHIIRNSIDHGIETPSERERKGKSKTGKLGLHAEHSGGQVVIKIEDDGAGIDSEKVKRKAVERGLITEDAHLTERDMLSLIFQPGFSTTQSANNVSGRGVGMDVIKREIEKLRGKVEIRSEKDGGTTMLLLIPLTLSIIDGLLVALGDERYVVNLSLIDECFEYHEEMRRSTSAKKYFTIREEIVPYIDLRRLFELEGSSEEENEIVVVRVNDQKIALIVDRILGQHQTVIKPISAALRKVEEISGSTILGDGSVAFILDINKIVEKLDV